MTRLESEKVVISQPAETIYNYLSDFNNIGKLMPSQVVEFSVTDDSCRFTIQGMATLGLKYVSKTPFTEIVMAKHEKAPFDFNLICQMKSLSESSTELQLVFDADLNPLLQMMASKPLKNFLDLLVNKYKEISSVS